MKLATMKQMKSAAAALLQLLLLIATGNANPLSRCGENMFFDDVAEICTNCDDICNPLRLTPYLCEQHADECGTHDESQGTSTVPPTTYVATNQPPSRSSQASISKIFVIITVSCMLVTVAALIFMVLVFCKQCHVLCFRHCNCAEHTGSTAVYPATAVSSSKEAIAPNQIKRPAVPDVSVSLLNQAAAGPANDVGDVATATG